MNIGTAMKSLPIIHRSLCLVIATSILLTLTGCETTPKAANNANDNKVYSFWPPYPNEPHVQFLVAFSRAKDLLPPKSSLDELIYGKETLKDLPIQKPYGVAMNDGKIYVCDLSNNCVVILDIRNKQTLMMGVKGAKTLLRPNAITISDDGLKYVSDLGNNNIMVFDAKDRYTSEFPLQNIKVADMAVYKNELYVTDLTGACIQVLDRYDGHVIRQIGKPGAQNGEFVKPLGISVDPTNGDVYADDILKCHTYRYSNDGKLLKTFGGRSDRVGGFARPKHIAVDSNRIIYVVDASFQNVQMFNPEGVVYAFFGGAGRHPGAMDLPAGVCVHNKDLDLFKQYVNPNFELTQLIVVSNQFGPNRISVYGMGHLKRGKTVKDIAPFKEDLKAPGLNDPNENTQTTTPELTDPNNTTMPNS